MEITRELVKIFADWIKLKIRIHVTESLTFPNKKEIWWVSLGQNVGVETNGKNKKFERPVLVTKVFNKDSSLVAPISSSIKRGRYKIEFMNGEGAKNTVNLSQLRTLDSRRFIRKVGEMAEPDFEQVVKELKKFF